MKPAMGKGWIAIAGLLAGALVLGFLLLAHGPHAAFWPKCPLHELTGLHCAGCGMTRATHAALRGDLVTAFRLNPVMVTLLALLLASLLWELLARCTGKSLPMRLRPSMRVFWIILTLLLVYTVLRNIPVWPFTLLAPP